MLRKLTGTSRDYLPTVLRIVLGIVFFAHGSQKMLGWFGGDGFEKTMAYFTNGMHIPAPFAFLAICAEFFGSLGLLLGFLTRIAAFGVGCDMLVALFTIHIHNGFFMNWSGTKPDEGFEYHLLALALIFAILVRGAGAFSLDRLISSGGAIPTRS